MLSGRRPAQATELDASDESFDPSTLLIVMNALTKLVDGIGVDPQSGLGAVTSVVLLTHGQIDLDHVGQFVAWTERASAWIAGATGTSAFGVLTRFGVPAFAEFLKNRAAQRREELTQIVKSTVEKLLK